jgi:hypothetical protein
MAFNPTNNPSLPPNTALLSNGITYIIESTGFAQRAVEILADGTRGRIGPESASEIFVLFDEMYTSNAYPPGTGPTVQVNIPVEPTPPPPPPNPPSKLTLTTEQKINLYPRVKNLLNSTVVLRRGDGSEAKPNGLVVELQEALLALGFELPVFGIDGVFRNETKAAVEAYQRASRISVDGVVGKDVRNALITDLQPPPPSKDPKVIQDERIQKLNLKNERELQARLTNIDVESLQNSVAEDQKSSGLQRLGELILKQAIKLSKFVLPLVTNLIFEYAVDELESALEENQEEIDKKKEELKEKFCNVQLPRIIEFRNNAVEYLNNTGKVLDSFTLGVDFGASFADILDSLVKILKQASFGLNQAAKGIPLVPGIVPAVVNDLNTITDIIVFKADGTPNIPPIQSVINQVSPAFATAQSVIVRCVDLLDKLDILITFCDPEAPLTPISDSINNIYENELLAESSENGSTYKGFILEIETRPFTDTVDQNRAVGKNKSDIILISTEYSFASDPQVLIDELKFIIDRDNLKAY